MQVLAPLLHMRLVRPDRPFLDKAAVDGVTRATERARERSPNEVANVAAKSPSHERNAR
jgi:hypothetical protein